MAPAEQRSRSLEKKEPHSGNYRKAVEQKLKAFLTPAQRELMEAGKE